MKVMPICFSSRQEILLVMTIHLSTGQCLKRIKGRRRFCWVAISIRMMRNESFPFIIRSFSVLMSARVLNSRQQ